MPAKKVTTKDTEMITTSQIEKSALTSALNDISKFGDGVLIIAGDLKTDMLYACFNGNFIPAEIKAANGEKIQLVKKVLEYNHDDNAVNSFLHFVDGVVFAFSKYIKKSANKSNKVNKIMKK